MKKTFIGLAVGLALTIPLAAYAATSDTAAAQTIRGFCGIDTAKLNEKQKTDLFNQWKKLMELRKETVNQLVAGGSITKEQGALTNQHIDTMIQYRKDNGFVGCGMNYGRGDRGRGMNGGGCNGGGCGGYFYQAPAK
ncbi:MAG TPA: DUF2680 domain-containing protein [Bacillota bacterium]|nr:DUF2680 domain-containing protein [Bacillota bacterium]